MAFVEYKNVGITGISACIPKKVANNDTDLSNLIPQEEIDKVINNIGIKQRRIADENTTAADLCYKAAENLLTELNVDRDEIDVLIFMTQLPDYRLPAGAPSLQNKLKLSKNTACFDISLACSGYIYSLSTAFAYASQPNIRKVLVLDGETFSKIVSDKDKVNAPLYGDAGTATLIEKGDFGKSFFSLHSDGSGEKAIYIKAGGGRHGVSNQALELKEREEGNIRTEHQVYMDGMEVFNFTMREVPRNVKNILKSTELTVNDIDQFVFHQANRFMIDFFKKKLKISDEKMNYSLDKFGNTSSATIPLTISSELNSLNTTEQKRILMSGFGGGLSWASSILNLKNTTILPVIEY